MAKSKSIKKLNEAKDLTTILGEDKDLLKEFQDFMKVKPVKVDTSEIAKHGGTLSNVSASIGQILGIFNPDDIRIDTYNLMRTHPQLQMGLKVIKLPIIGQQWTTICDDPDIAEFIDQVLRPLWYNLLTSTLTAIDFGFSAHEVVYQYQDLELLRKYDKAPFYKGKAVTWRKFKSLYPDSVKIKLDDKENFDGIIQTNIGKDVTLSVEKSFIFTHDKGDSFGNLFGVSRLKPCYDTWYYYQSLIMFMLRYFERKGTPPVIVKFPPGQSKRGTDNADTALEIGKSLISESVVAISSKTYENTPPMWSIEYLTDDKRGEMFLSALTFLENKMLRGLFVPERTVTQDSSSKAGSYSLSQTHADMFMLGEEALLVDIENQVNRYVVRRLVEYNFGAKAPQCYVKIERITDARKDFLKQVFMEMIKSGSALPAAREIADVVGVPLDDDGKINNDSNKVDKQNNKLDKTNKQDKNKVDNKKFDENTWWRSTNEYEDPVILSDIETNMNELENKYIKIFVNDIWEKQRSQVINRVEKMLSDKTSVEDIWYEKVNDNNTESIILWQPMRGKMLNVMLNFMKESFKVGQESAISELKVDDKTSATSEERLFLQNRSRTIVDKYFSNIKYVTELVILSANSENKTSTDIINDIQKQFNTVKDRDLKNIVTTESLFALNKGRKKIADNYIK